MMVKILRVSLALAVLIASVSSLLMLQGSATQETSSPPAFLTKINLWQEKADPSLVLHDNYSLENEDALVRILVIGALLGIPNEAIRFGPSGNKQLPIGVFVLPEWDLTITAAVQYLVAQENSFPVELCYQNQEQMNQAISLVETLGVYYPFVWVIQCGEPSNGGVLIIFPSDSPFTGIPPDNPIPMPIGIGEMLA
jgi:hypothetical protein